MFPLSLISSPLSTGAGNRSVEAKAAFNNTYSTDFDGVNDTVTWLSDTYFTDTFGAGDFSVSYWVKSADIFDAGSNPNGFLMYGLAFSGGLHLLSMGSVFGPAHGTPSFRNKMLFQATGAVNHFTTFSTDLSAVLSDNTWFHVVYTSSYGGGQRVGKIYVNGSDVTDADSAAAGGADITSLNVGKETLGAQWQISSYARYLEQNMDEIAFYDAVLSSSDVTDIYNSGVPNDRSGDSNLVNYWRMGDGDVAGTIIDYGSGGNDLKTNGATFAEDVPS